MGPGQPKPTIESGKEESFPIRRLPKRTLPRLRPRQMRQHPKRLTVTVRQPRPSESDDEDETSSSSDELQDDSNSDEESVDISSPSSRPGLGRPEPLLVQCDSPPPTPNVDIPLFITPNVLESERALKEKFRKFWMGSIAEGFKNDLEEIRKVCAP